MKRTGQILITTLVGGAIAFVGWLGANVYSNLNNRVVSLETANINNEAQHLQYTADIAQINTKLDFLLGEYGAKYQNGTVVNK